MNKPFKLFEFDPQLYPRLLWVAIGDNSEELNKTLRYRDGTPLEKDALSGCYGITCRVAEKKTGLYGTLVWFRNHQIMTDQNKSHEAGHATFDIMSDIEAAYSPKFQEPYCYLLGWVADCIWRAEHNKVDQKNDTK